MLRQFIVKVILLANSNLDYFPIYIFIYIFIDVEFDSRIYIKVHIKVHYTEIMSGNVC